MKTTGGKMGIKLFKLSILCIGWLFAGCANAGSTPAAVPTETSMPLATEIALQPTPTASVTPLAPTPIPTHTETPTTIPSTETAVSTPKPFTDGFIALVWNPDEEDDRLIMTYQLNFIYPGTSPDEWLLETKLEDLYTPHMYQAPDQNKLLLTQYKDSNGDGRIPSLGLADVYDIYLYHITDETLTLQVENDYAQPESFWFPSPYIFWFPDSNKFTYLLKKKIMTADIAQSSPVSIFNLPAGDIFSYELSPDGNWLAVFNTIADTLGVRDSDIDLDILNLETEEMITLAEGIGPGRFKWAPNSFNFAFNERVKSGLYIADTQIFSTTELVTNDNSYILSAWSPDSKWLAFSYDRHNIYIWNVQEGKIENVYTINPNLETQFQIQQIVWAPDNSGIFVSAITPAPEITQLSYLNRETGVFEELLAIDVSHMLLEELPMVYEIQILDFSPDGQWVLFYAEIDRIAGFYVIHRDGGAAHLVLETGKKYFRPYHVSWLDVVP
jgi:WD40 repeat protein